MFFNSKERLKDGPKDFSVTESDSSTIDIEVHLSALETNVGSKTVAVVRVLLNGTPYRKEVPLRLELTGSAVFFANGKNVMDVTTGADGVATAVITSADGGKFYLNVRLNLPVEKK